jgi:hypothetical protein
MGLDMYLDRKYHRSFWSSDGSKARQIADALDIDDCTRIIDVSERVGYWRKANHIHRWFVENIQGGKDNCAEYHVPQEALQELLEACNKVLADPSLAETILPVQGGCFFGTTSYDDSYIQSTQATAQLLQKLLSENLPVDYYYYSSW